MPKANQRYRTITEYIALFPPPVRRLLASVRQAIASCAPTATETINYGIPTFKLGGRNLVHFAAFKHHIGFYPTPAAISFFQKELTGFKQAKGSVQFPLEGPMPIGTIKRMVKFRVNQITTAASKKK